MSRIRSIKPSAFTSLSLSQVSPAARWLFAGLWTYMDDIGRCPADARLIKGALFPVDDATSVADIQEWIAELEENGHIHAFIDDEGRTWLHAPQFNKHQRINRPTPPTSPTCPCQFNESSLTPHGGVLVGREGEGEEEEEEEGEGEASRPGPTNQAESQPSRVRPPRKCPIHLHHPDPPPCGKCADARRAHDEWRPPTPVTPTTMCGLHPDHPALNCPECKAATVPPPAGWRKRKKP